jgi:SAM-dependent methyltransferase
MLLVSAPRAVMMPAMAEPLYDRIGVTYARHRRPDTRIAARIADALGDARTVLDVGAGAGSYEPADRAVIAVEPSWVMIRQRSAAAAPVLRGVAEALPFADDAFDATLAVLTVHHWRDPEGGLAELRRVARRVVVVTWDPAVYAQHFWLTRDYLPEIAVAERDLATLARVVAALPGSDVAALPVPHDCSDGFCGAYWRRPEVYLDADARAAISALARLEDDVLQPAMARLAADLQSGAWRARNADVVARDALDLGYRLVRWQR